MARLRSKVNDRAGYLEFCPSILVLTIFLRRLTDRINFNPGFDLEVSAKLSEALSSLSRAK